MSVVKSKRKEGQLTIFTKASNLAEHTIKICSNEKYFPKHYRWCLTSRIVNAALDINDNLIAANSIYVNDHEDYVLRKQHQQIAIAASCTLLSNVAFAQNVFHLESKKIEYWTGLITEVQTALRNWKKSDAERYKEYK